ncbi:MAG: TolC family protein, partial [Rickettsiales bacterium]|nr:TolC family protein [Rickettsiales bacterium]
DRICDSAIMQLLIISISTLIFFSQEIFAQEVLSKENSIKDLSSAIYSWQECIEIAAQNNNNLKSAIAAERSTYFQSNAAASGFLPQASATLSSNRGTGGNASNPSITTVQGNITQAYSGSVSLTQNLFSGFLDVGKFDQAKANNMVAKANITIAKAQVSYDLKAAYQNFYYAKESVKLLDSIIKRRQDNLHIIELRFKSGMENKGSLLLAQAYLEQAKFNRLQGANLIETARAQLCKALGISDCKNYDISDSVPTKAPKILNSLDFKNILEKTPQHLQAIAQEQAAKAGILIAQSTFMPSLNLTGTKGQRGSNFFPQNDYWSVGMNLTFPFFTGGKDYYTTRSAYASSSAAKENRENIDQQILVNLKQSYNSYIEAVAKLKVDANFKEATQLRAEIARNKYNNGLLIFENWDAIETDLINRQTTYLQSVLNRVTSEAAWEQAQGQGVFNND